MSVEGPSARTSPRSDLVTLCNQRALIDTGVLVRTGVLSRDCKYPHRASPVLVSHCSHEHVLHPRYSTTPRAEHHALRNRLRTARSMPVPTKRFFGRSVGTAWRCMFEPMSARLASSCSRNGMSAAATDTICAEQYVHELDTVTGLKREFVLMTTRHKSSVNCLFVSPAR